MLSVSMALVMCWIILRCSLDTPIGRLLFRLLVEAPAARLSRITQGDVVVCILILVGIGMLAFTEDGAKIRMAMMAVPEIGIWLTTFEVSAYLDVTVALVAGVSSLRRRGIFPRAAAILGHISRVRERRRDRRTRPVRSESEAANDGDHRRTAALAA